MPDSISSINLVGAAVNKRTGGWAFCLVLAAFGLLAAAADDQSVAQEIKAAQARFIADINKADYERVVSAFHPTYKGLIDDQGFQTLDVRLDEFKKRFMSDDHGTITILESEVRPLGEDYAMLRSHIKMEFKKKEPSDWWYTALYIRSGKEWKVIHEQ